MYSTQICARFWAKVNKTETCWVWTASLWGGGYGQFKISTKGFPAHRLSYEIANGPIPAGLVIDHICHNRACVNPAHLRATSHKQNLEHRAGATKRSTTGIRGVRWDKARKKWTAEVVHNYRTIFLGRFASVADAEAAVVAKRNELFTHNDLDRYPREATS